MDSMGDGEFVCWLILNKICFISTFCFCVFHLFKCVHLFHLQSMEADGCPSWACLVLQEVSSCPLLSTQGGGWYEVNSLCFTLVSLDQQLFTNWIVLGLDWSEIRHILTGRFLWYIQTPLSPSSQKAVLNWSRSWVKSCCVTWVQFRNIFQDY